VDHTTPLLRKYAFHMILAGHRFGKSAQKRHAARAYQQALQVLSTLRESAKVPNKSVVFFVH